MSTPWAEFVGNSYEFTGSKYAGVERTANFYVVVNESNDSKFKMLLAPSPGNAPFCPLPVPAPFNQPNRGLLNCRGVVYGVNGTIVFSIDKNGAFTNIGSVVTDVDPINGKPATPAIMVANGTGQVFISTRDVGGITKAYVIPAGGGANSLIPVNSPGFLGCSAATFQDGYIIAINPNSNVLQISGSLQTPLGDATQWDAGNVSAQAGQSDYLRALISSREYVHLMGAQRSQIYENVGNNGLGGFPFSNANSTFIETGIGPPRSLQELGGSIVWVGEDARGQRACWRDDAFTPQRISTFAVEQQWQNYARIDDAVAMTYIWRGHLMYQITFPGAILNNPPSGFPLGPPAIKTYTSATWVYDATTSQLIGRPAWHERQFLNSFGALGGRPEMFHAYCYGLHLVGSTGADGNPGAIYQYSDGPTGFADCIQVNGAQTTTAIVRDRVCPHVWESFKRIIYNRLEFELARGIGLSGNPPVGQDPVFMVRLSRDGGNTFGDEYTVRAGAIGNFLQRSYLARLGYARDMVVWVRCSDPTYWSFSGAHWDLFECGS